MSSLLWGADCCLACPWALRPFAFSPVVLGAESLCWRLHPAFWVLNLTAAASPAALQASQHPKLDDICAVCGVADATIRAVYKDMHPFLVGVCWAHRAGPGRGGEERGSASARGGGWGGGG